MNLPEKTGGETSARITPQDNINSVSHTISSFEINGNEAEVFLKLFAQDESITFQTLPERKGGSEAGLTRVFHGTLMDHLPLLSKLNKEGCGIFYTVNATDLKGRRVENIIAVRSVFVDLDGAPLEPIHAAPLEPHVIVESSPGRYHAYWIVEDIALSEFSNIQKYLAEMFNGDKAVHDLPRLMRLPGFYHLKKAPFRSRVIHQSSAQPYCKQKFIDSFGIGDSHTPCLKAESIDDNRVLNELIRRSLIIKQETHPERSWIIKCPWNQQHTKEDSGTRYFEPSFDVPTGGFKCFHNHCKDRKIKDLLDYLGIGHPIEPLPLHRPLTSPEPFPMDALGDIIGSAAKALHKIIRAPDAICAQSVLGAVALVCQPVANIQIDGREIPLSLFLLTVAESGERKSATDNAALKPIYEYQKMLKNVYREEVAKYQNDHDRWEAKKKEWLKNSIQGGMTSFDEPAPIAPLRPLMLIDEPTYEGLVKYLAVGYPSIGLFSDEGGRFFGGHSMNQDNQVHTIGGLSSLWDGKPISRMRAADGDMTLYGRRVSVHLMIQEVILEQLMNDRFLTKQGFLPRFLTSFPSTTAGHRPYVERDITQDPALCLYKDRINRLLDTKLPVEPLPAPQNELRPKGLLLANSAKQAWITFHDQIDMEIAPGNRLEPVKRFASKAAEHVLRLAGNLAVFEQPDVIQIEEIYIQRGIRLVNYYLSEILRIQGFLAINPELLLAQRVLEFFWDRGEEIVPLMDVYQKGPSAIRQAKKAREIMKILQDHGWVEPCVKGIEIEGKKHQEAWKIKQKI